MGSKISRAVNTVESLKSVAEIAKRTERAAEMAAKSAELAKKAKQAVQATENTTNASRGQTQYLSQVADPDTPDTDASRLWFTDVGSDLIKHPESPGFVRTVTSCAPGDLELSDFFAGPFRPRQPKKDIVPDSQRRLIIVRDVPIEDYNAGAPYTRFATLKDLVNDPTARFIYRTNDYNPNDPSNFEAYEQPITLYNIYENRGMYWSKLGPGPIITDRGKRAAYTLRLLNSEGVHDGEVYNNALATLEKLRRSPEYNSNHDPFTHGVPTMIAGEKTVSWDSGLQRYILDRSEDIRQRQKARNYAGDPVYEYKYTVNPQSRNLEMAPILQYDGASYAIKNFPRGARYFDNNDISNTSSDSTPLLWANVSRHMGTSPGQFYVQLMKNSDGNPITSTINNFGDAAIWFDDLMGYPEIEKILRKTYNGYDSPSIDRLSDEEVLQLKNLIEPIYNDVARKTYDKFIRTFGYMVEKNPELKKGASLIAIKPLSNDHLRNIVNAGGTRISMQIPSLMFGRYKKGGELKNFYSSLRDIQ